MHQKHSCQLLLGSSFANFLFWPTGFGGNNLTGKTKLLVYKLHIHNILLFGNEAWTTIYISVYICITWKDKVSKAFVLYDADKAKKVLLGWKKPVFKNTVYQEVPEHKSSEVTFEVENSLSLDCQGEKLTQSRDSGRTALHTLDHFERTTWDGCCVQSTTKLRKTFLGPGDVRVPNCSSQVPSNVTWSMPEFRETLDTLYLSLKSGWQL